jgi:hypothetical protein
MYLESQMSPHVLFDFNFLIQKKIIFYFPKLIPTPTPAAIALTPTYQQWPSTLSLRSLSLEQNSSTK